MTNSSSVKRTTHLRRGLAGLVAATTLALGGAGVANAETSQTQGVRTVTASTYAVTSDTNRVVTTSARSRGL